MWEYNDHNNYNQHVKHQRGQICNDGFSIEIRNLAKNTNNKSFLEIGTWNGMGSTKQFVEELSARNDDFVFYSLECNKEKSEFAQELYKNQQNVHILNEVIFNETPSNFYDIFPQCKTNEMYKKWNDVDIFNMQQSKLFLERKDLPEVFDVILLDGGEFTTYFEYQILKDRCKYLMLDDIKVDKCTLIVKEIEENPDKWEIVNKNMETRNGFMICKNISNL